MLTWKWALIGLACLAVILSLVSVSASRDVSQDSITEAYECLRAATVATVSVGSSKSPGAEVYVACMHAKGYGQRVAWEIYKDKLMRED